MSNSNPLPNNRPNPYTPANANNQPQPAPAPNTLSSRINQPNQQNAPAQPTFASRFGGGNANNNAPAPAPAAPRPPGSLLARVPAKLNWRVLPVTGTVVHFNLEGLGDPFYRLLGKRLVIDFGKPRAVMEALAAGGEDVDEIKARLDIAWQEYDLKGAMLLYPYNKDLPWILSGRMPQPEEQPLADLDDEQPQPPPPPAQFNDENRVLSPVIRALDLLLVLNVLARTRSFILLANAPLAMETGFLQQSFVTDDPRLVALVQATGCITESAPR